MRKENIFKNFINYSNRFFNYFLIVFNYLFKNKTLLFFLKIISGVSLLALSSYATIPIPFSPVPITLQVFSVILISFIFNSNEALSIIFSYIVLGVLGLPVFAQGTYGIIKLLGPTCGYLIGFLVASGFISLINNKRNFINFISIFILSLVGLFIIYFFGIIRLSFTFGIEKSLKLGFYPFIFYDLIKIILVSFIYYEYKKFNVFKKIKDEIKRN